MACVQNVKTNKKKLAITKRHGELFGVARLRLRLLPQHQDGVFVFVAIWRHILLPHHT